MRLLAALLLLAAVAVADGGARLTPEQQQELVRVVGEKQWGALPPWRQRMVADRYGRFLKASERKQTSIREAGLRSFLVYPGRKRQAKQELPRPLQEELNKLAPGVRPLAGKLAYIRLRQLRFDRSLRRVPFEQRWPLFRRLFPEPFDESVAKVAHKELRRFVVNGIAKEVRARLEKDEKGGDKKRLVQRAIEEEERQVVERIRKELFRFQGANPKRVRRILEQQGLHLLEQVRFAPPRQRELIRYAFRPHDCPLLDLSFLGPRPEDKAARRLWERDYRVFARLELLAEAGFPREMVLYLAGTGSPEDFLRAVRALRRPQPPRKRRGVDPAATEDD